MSLHLIIIIADNFEAFHTKIAGTAFVFKGQMSFAQDTECMNGVKKWLNFESHVILQVIHGASFGSLGLNITYLSTYKQYQWWIQEVLAMSLASCTTDFLAMFLHTKEARLPRILRHVHS